MYETWYCRAKETNHGETHVGKSEQPDITDETGELEPKRSRRREAGCRNIGSLFGNTSDAWKFGPVFAMVARSINGTAANSGLGTEIACHAVADKMQCFHIACSLHDT